MGLLDEEAGQHPHPPDPLPEGVAASTVDLLSWWRVHQEQLPLLSYLARVVMCVPVASSSSERVFSLSGRLVTPARNRLDPTKVEAMVLITANLKKLKEWEIRK